MEHLSDTARRSTALGQRVVSSRDLAKTAQASKLATLIADRGISQSDLARMTGLRRDVISRACRGANVLSKANLNIIAGALEVEPSDIVAPALRTVMDDLPIGVHSTHMGDNKVWVRMNAEVWNGAHTAIEMLANHDRPVTMHQLGKIIAALEA